MLLTLGECARQLGISKGTVSKAIKTGKLSATKREDHSFGIDPAELARYVAVNGHRFHTGHPATPVEQIEIRARAELAEARLADLKVMVEELKAERDAWREQASRLAIPPPSVAKRQWWSFRKAG
jgi:excisionase family DNA binding protein